MSKKIRMDGRSSEKTDFDSLMSAEIEAAAHNQDSIHEIMADVAARLQALRSELLPTQLAMLEDKAKRKAAICTRRSGKTYHNRHAAAEAVVNNPWVNKRKAQPVVQYIAQTQKKALDLFWVPFKVLCERIGLEAHWDDSNLRAQFANGVLVRAGGVDKSEDIEKYRGDAYVLVIIDEAASFGPKVESLIMAGLGMAMADYEGTIIMTGTPGQAQVGYFYEIYMGAHPEWSLQPCWTFRENFHLPEATRTDQWIIENVGPLDSPKVLREAYGRWVSDASTLVYQYSSERNDWDGPLPAGHDWNYLLGIDLGFRDPTAFVIGAYAKTHPWLFIVHSESTSHLLPSQVEARIAEFVQKYKFSRIVVDIGGSMALSCVEEWNMRGKYGLMPAEKTKKHAFIEHMNSDFQLGRIRVLKGLSVTKYWKTLPWDDADDEKGQTRHDGRSVEHKGFENHECDAALYMYRESRHYRAKDPEPPPEPGSPDYWRKMQLHAKLNALQKTQIKGFRYGRLRN